MDFESPDDIEARYRKQTPAKNFPIFRHETSHDYAVPEPQRQEETGTASGSESDYYENNGENADR